jgi:hypothetical protein
MPVQIAADNPVKAAVSVSSQCRLLKMSRSQFYWHVKRGTFHAPLYLASNKRPYFTASMVEDNLRARDTGIGVNGEFVIFYERLPNPVKPETKSSRANNASLIQAIKKGGLKDVTNEQVEAALAVCFPEGTSGQDDSVILTKVFRHLKRPGTAS